MLQLIQNAFKKGATHKNVKISRTARFLIENLYTDRKKKTVRLG